MGNAVKAAITHARTARGADDASNDWFSDVAGGSFAPVTCAHTQVASAGLEEEGDEHRHQEWGNPCAWHVGSGVAPAPDMHTDDHDVLSLDEGVGSGVAPAPDHLHRVSNADVGDDEVTVMTALISDPITAAVEKTLDSQGFPQMAMQLGTEEGLNRVLDDITWNANLEKVKGYLNGALVRAAVLMHTGCTFFSQYRSENIYGNSKSGAKAKKDTRIETCLALRMLQLIQLFVAFSVPWCLIVPQWVHGGPISMFDMPDFEELRKKAYVNTFRYEGKLYQLASDVIPLICKETLDLEKHIASMITISSQYEQAGVWGQVDSAQAKAAKRAKVLKYLLLQAKEARRDDADDGLKNPVKSTMNLKGAIHDERQRENREAIGGCEIPALVLSEYLVTSTLASMWRRSSLST